MYTLDPMGHSPSKGNRSLSAGQPNRRRSRHGRHPSVDLGSPTREGLDWSFRNSQCKTLYREAEPMEPALVVPPMIDLNKVSRALAEFEVDLKRRSVVLASPIKENSFQATNPLGLYGHSQQTAMNYVHVPSRYEVSPEKQIFESELGTGLDDETLWSQRNADIVYKLNEIRDSPNGTVPGSNPGDIAPYRFNT